MWKRNHNEMSNENYNTLNDEWKEEMLKLPVEALIELVSKSKQDLERLRELADFREQCRNYLMGVYSNKLTVEDALESLGYGRDGLIS